MILLIPVVFILMYMVLLRPQQQRVRRQQQLISTIGVGDRVVTAGGLIGRVVEAEDDRVWVELADDVVVEMLRMYVIKRLEEVPPDADDLDDQDDQTEDMDSPIAVDPDDADTGPAGSGGRDGTGPTAESHSLHDPVDDGHTAVPHALHPDGAANVPDASGGAAPASAPGPGPGPGPGPTGGPAAAGPAGPEPDVH
jgi:preprotein translocase subunit YajC